MKTEGLTQLRNAYPLSEFIRSPDPLFRPVDMATAPDGTLYITDMYRGIIRRRPWAGRGTYLRRRSSSTSWTRSSPRPDLAADATTAWSATAPQPRMLNETPAQLVAHLSPPERLVARHRAAAARAQAGQVRRAGAAEARGHARRHESARAASTRCGRSRVSARSTPALVREQLKDADPPMRIQAIRASETLYKAGDRSLGGRLSRCGEGRRHRRRIQAMLTLERAQGRRICSRSSRRRRPRTRRAAFS